MFYNSNLYFTAGLWGILNNTGISGSIGPADWLKPEDYHKVVAVNLLGLIDVTHTFMPLIKKTNGRIVNTGKPRHENFEIHSRSFNRSNRTVLQNVKRIQFIL